MDGNEARRGLPRSGWQASPYQGPRWRAAIRGKMPPNDMRDPPNTSSVNMLTSIPARPAAMARGEAFPNDRLRA